MLLRVVPELEPVSRLDAARVGLLDAREEPEERGLARSVEAEDHHPRTLVDREVDVGEDLERAVGLAELVGAQRRLSARGGLGEPERGDLVVAARGLEPHHELLRPLEHALSRGRLGRLGAHLVRLGDERLRLALGVVSLAVAPSLVLFALLEVRVPSEAVLVELRAVRVEVEHLVGARAQEARVVGDHDEAAGVRAEEVAQPDDRVGVEVVGRLVEQEGLGVPEEDARELDAAPLAAGEGADRLAQRRVGEAEVRGDPRRLALGGVAARGAEPLLDPAVAGDRLVAHCVVGGRHALLGLPHLLHEDVEVPRGEDPVDRQDLEVARPRVLGQVADLAARRHRAARRKDLPRENPRQRRLAGPVAPHEPDAVPGRPP